MFAHRLLSVLIPLHLVIPLGSEALAQAPKYPEKYTLDYPAADQFCPPIRSTFFEVTRTFSVVRGKRFKHKPNGGYGLPVADKVDGKNLLHVGADLGWYQIDEPVFAVANGVVRLSAGPKAPNARTISGAQAAALPWGNLVVLEHRLPSGEFYTTIYGHLASKRLVKAGDIVKAGQPLGMIGRQNKQINGGYTPHLHFGVRKGRMAENGAKLVRMTMNGKQAWMTLERVGEEWSEMKMPEGARLPLPLTYNGVTSTIKEREGKPMVRSEFLWRVLRPDFPLVGYSLTTDGFEDPVRFLRTQRADRNPAPYRIR